MKRALSVAAVTLVAALTVPTVRADARPAAAGSTAHFSQIKITGSDTVRPPEMTPGAARSTYYNPILPGFYPDPSVIRVGADYYLVNSSFAYYPGIPVFHSKDLIHWTQIGNAIDRPGMLDFSGLGTSRGVFAPDISYHDGLFYIVNTCVDCKGNFVITAKDPKGPWSDPVWLPFGGIDPSIFWDDDGRAYIVYNDGPEGTPLYNGHRALWLQGFDPKTMTMTGTPQVLVNGGVDISKKPVWIEGPHIFKKDGHYYLNAAEGGTADNHSEVIFRADSVAGRYVPWSDNPILTQRDLDPARADPITSSGHAKLVEAPDGQWWSVFLATRPYDGGLYNTGRETFLLPVTWTDDDWPVILAHGATVPHFVTRPEIKTAPDTGVRSHLGYEHIGVHWGLDWLQIRTPKTPFLTVGKDKAVTLIALNEAIGDVTSHPAFTGLRQEQPNTDFDVILTYRPGHDGDRAGIVAVQNDDFYLFFGRAKRDGRDVIEVTRRAGSADPRDGVVIARLPAPTGNQIVLACHFAGGTARFSYHVPSRHHGHGPDIVVADGVDATNLSTAKAGGFVGTIIGPYAYSQNP